MTRRNDHEHTCTVNVGYCASCDACRDMRLTVRSKSEAMPNILVCCHCDGPESAGNIQRGPVSPA